MRAVKQAPHIAGKTCFNKGAAVQILGRELADVGRAISAQDAPILASSGDRSTSPWALQDSESTLLSMLAHGPISPAPQ